jgi:ATP-dependent RNA helicase DDX3X
MAEEKKSYVPPYRRSKEHQPSKFEMFLTNHGDRKDFFQRSPDYAQAESEWGSRDHRSGYIDKETHDETEKLFADHSVDSGISFERYEDIPVESSEEMPVMDSFTDCDVHPTMLNNINRLQYETPTPVQKHAIPIYLMRRDLMACAQTGSGKTAAYLFPMVAKMLNDGPPPPQRTKIAMPVGLCLSPTRELAVQIYEETMKFAAATGIRTVAIYGGADQKV